MTRLDLLTLLLLLAMPGTASAHPGRLSADGCHDVHTRFVHKSGKVDELGSRHCHRALGDMKLDGQEQLEDGPTRFLPRPEDRERSRESR